MKKYQYVLTFYYKALDKYSSIDINNNKLTNASKKKKFDVK